MAASVLRKDFAWRTLNCTFHWMPSYCRLKETSNQRTRNVTQSWELRGFCLPTESCITGKVFNLLGQQLAISSTIVVALLVYFTGWLLRWKEGSGVCRAGSASTFITIPGSRISSPTRSLSFWLSIPPPSPHLMVETEPFLSLWIPKSNSYYASGVEIRLPAKAGQRAPAGTEANLVVWLQDLEGCRRMHCTRALLLEIKSELFSWAGFARAKCSRAPFFCMLSQGNSNKTQRSSFVGVEVLFESLWSLCTCKSRFSSRFYVCLATHRVVP